MIPLHEIREAELAADRLEDAVEELRMARAEFEAYPCDFNAMWVRGCDIAYDDALGLAQEWTPDV